MTGERLSHYRLLTRLGQGGMGIVYKAEDLKLRRLVAVKVLPQVLQEDADARRRLVREARAASSLNHPGICTIHDIEEADGRIFIVMELVEAEGLNTRLARGPLAPAEIASIGRQAAEALEYAHRRGVVHRDIKPSNLLVDRDGRVKIVDFGLAIQHGPAPVPASPDERETEAVRITQEGHTTGTILYMCPEQARGATPDGRGDLFSLGVVLYECATGIAPFGGASPLETAAALLHEEPVPPRRLRPEVPAGLEAVILACLRKDPAERPPNGAAVAQALKGLEQGRSTRSIRAVIAPRSLRRRSRVAWGALAVVVAAWVGYEAWIHRPHPVDDVGSAEARRVAAQAALYEQRGMGLSNLANAEKLWREALSLEPGSAWLMGRLAVVLVLEDKYSPEASHTPEIDALVGRAAATGKEFAPVCTARGWRLLARGDVDGALREGLRALVLDPRFYEGYHLAGEARMRAGAADEGITTLRRGVAGSSDWISARLVLAEALLRLSRIHEAAVEYEALLRYQPDSPDALNNLGAIHLNDGNYVEAVRMFRALLALNPNDDYAASNLGTAYFYLARLPDAIEAYETALRVAPDNPLYAMNLADAREESGDREGAAAAYARAEAAFSKVLEGKPGDPRMLAMRGLVLARLGRATEALADAKASLQKGPDDAEVLACGAGVYALTGDRGNAFEHVRRAVAAGYPVEDLRRSPNFAAYRSDPEFFALLMKKP